MHQPQSFVGDTYPAVRRLQTQRPEVESVCIGLERLVGEDGFHGLLRVGVECVHFRRRVSFSHNNDLNAIMHGTTYAYVTYGGSRLDGADKYV